LIDEAKNVGLVVLKRGFSTKYIGKWQSQMVNLFFYHSLIAHVGIKSVNFLSKAGYKYIIRFRKEDENFGGINVVSISFDLLSDKLKPLELKDIFSIAEIFEQYILQNNVILTYVCDNEPVKTSDRNKTLSP